MLDTLANSPTGSLVQIGGGRRAYVPHPLPRRIDLDASLVYRLDAASRAVATLDGVGETLTNPLLLTVPFMRREAVLSSRIEGTQASVSDVFLYEASPHPRGDVLEVYNYVKALQKGLSLLDSLPISIRLINNVHAVLLKGVRGQDKLPGRLRDRQVWIGTEDTPIEESRYVPPPADRVLDAMSDWERFANESIEMPPLIRCAILHYQFEAIHPYLDGNGRVGRLLIALFLRAAQVMRTPLLYLSAYFERDRQRYYNELLRMSVTGDWSAWLDYFLTGVDEQARDALARARQLRLLHEQYRALVQQQRSSTNVLRLLDTLFEQPYVTAPGAAKLLGITYQGARPILDKLVDLGILVVDPGAWPMVYLGSRILEIIQAPSAIES